MPNPGKKEKQDEFIARFMGDEKAKKDFPDEKQRLAVAYSKWKAERKKVAANAAAEVFNEQARVPAGSSKGGQFTSKGGSSKVTTDAMKARTKLMNSLSLLPGRYEAGSKKVALFQDELKSAGFTKSSASSDTLRIFIHKPTGLRVDIRRDNYQGPKDVVEYKKQYWKDK